MPKLGDIPEDSTATLPLKGMEWFRNAVRLCEGGSYLLAGEPGVGKTTIAMQLAVDLSSQGFEVLYLTNEQSESELKTTADRIIADLPGASAIKEAVYSHLELAKLSQLEYLDAFRDDIFLPEGRWAHTKCLVLDSVQGGGLAPSARKAYHVLERFLQATKHHKIASILIAHVTKGGEIAGPKDLQFAVDVVLQFRRAFKLRPLFIPKNRYGPARFDPIPLMMREGGLYSPPQAKPVGTTIPAVDFSELSRVGVQARVTIPKWGERAGLNAPYLPKEKLRLLIDCISALPEVDASELTYQIACYLPGNNAYSSGLDLAVIMAILASYLQRDVPDGTGFYGEVDLHGNVLSPIDGGEARLAKSPKPSEEDDTDDSDPMATFLERIETLKRILVPPDSVKGLAKWKGLGGGSPKLVTAATVTEAVGQSWPDLV